MKRPLSEQRPLLNLVTVLSTHQESTGRSSPAILCGKHSRRLRNIIGQFNTCIQRRSRYQQRDRTDNRNSHHRRQHIRHRGYFTAACRASAAAGVVRQRLTFFRLLNAAPAAAIAVVRFLHDLRDGRFRTAAGDFRSLFLLYLMFAAAPARRAIERHRRSQDDRDQCQHSKQAGDLSGTSFHQSLIYDPIGHLSSFKC